MKPGDLVRYSGAYPEYHEKEAVGAIGQLENIDGIYAQVHWFFRKGPGMPSVSVFKENVEVIYANR